MFTQWDRRLIAFEAEFEPWFGSKRDVVQERFGIPLAQYYRELNAALDLPEALEAMPAEVHRLRRRRSIHRLEQRRWSRAA